MSIHEDDLKRWASTEEVIRKIDVLLYGIDLSKLSVKEQEFVKEQAKRRRELEEMKERLNPKPKPKLSKSEELERRRMEVLEAKIDKSANGRPVKELSNGGLEKQLKIMRVMVEKKGGAIIGYLQRID